MYLSLPPSSRRYQSTPATARSRRCVDALLPTPAPRSEAGWTCGVSQRMPPRSQWRVPMRYKVGAEQLQQVPSLGDRPDGMVRSARTDPVGPRSGRRDRHPTSAGSGRMGLRCAMTMGKRRALLRSALAVSPRSSPTVSWPETEVARFASQADQHPSAAWGTAATVGDTSARLDAAPGVRLGAAP